MENNVIMLSEEERAKLEKFSKTGVHSALLIRRAKVILALDRSNKKEHLRITRISKEQNISRQSIYEIRDDYLASVSAEDFLSRKKRATPPNPPKITGEVEAHIIALSCSEPPSGYAKWTLRLLEKRVVELNYVDDISHTTVSRVLKKHNSNLI